MNYMNCIQAKGAVYFHWSIIYLFVVFYFVTICLFVCIDYVYGV